VLKKKSYGAARGVVSCVEASSFRGAGRNFSVN